MASNPLLNAETEALISRLVADSFDYFANGTSTNTWNPCLGPSQIGLSYHDYEEPLSSYERQLLEGLDPADFNDDWTATDTPVLNLPGAALSPQSVPNLTPNERWDPDSETSEEYKQDRIMAAQHKEVMEERELNGLRMPSPVPILGGGRIAAVAKDCRDPVLECQRIGFPRLAGDFVPASQASHVMHFRGRSSFRSRNVSQGSNKGDVLFTEDQSRIPKRGRPTLPGARSDDGFKPRGGTCRRGLQGRLRCRRSNSKDRFSRPGFSEQSSELTSLSQRHRIDSSSLCGFRNPRVADWSRANTYNVPNLEERQQRLQTPEDSSKGRLDRTLRPSSRYLLESLTNEEDNDVGEMTSQPTYKDKGKGKEREPSPPPAPQYLPESHDICEGDMHPYKPSADYLDYEVTLDAETGESIVHVPWPRRDPEQARLSDSTVVEIHLGETAADDCHVRELFGNISLDDLADSQHHHHR